MKASELDVPGVVKESGKKKKRKKKEHPTPRGKEHTKELPDFWRKNFDYGESPYMNIGFIENITDKPKKKKKKKSAIISDFIALADKLDELGLNKEAAVVDQILRQASIMNARSDLIEASEVDRIFKTAVEEWEYYGYQSPEDYEDKVKSTREQTADQNQEAYP